MTATVHEANRAMMISPLFTILDRHPNDPARGIRSTPIDTWAQGLGALLDRLAPKFNGDGVVMLDQAATRALGLPLGPAETVTRGVDDARAAGWLSGKPAAWMPFYGDGRPTLVLALQSWPDFDRSPLVFPASSLDTVHRLSLWQMLTGSAWRGTPGVAGLTVMRNHLPIFKSGNRNLRPSLRYVDGPADAFELDFEPEQWSRPQELPYAHGYDATRAYLAAAGAIDCLSPWGLKPSPRRTFDPKLGGWWRVELGPWNDDRIPAPAGPGESVRWVTTPTLTLLQELQTKGGPYQSFEVLEALTGPGKRVLRNWAETLEDTFQRARFYAEHPDVADARMEGGMPTGYDDDARAVMNAVKVAYPEAWGLLNREGNAVYRPDWHYGILAWHRSVLWRKMWAVGQAEDRWPLEIKVDNCWYESEHADPEQARPAGLPRTNRSDQTNALGTFKVKGTRTKGKAA